MKKTLPSCFVKWPMDERVMLWMLGMSTAPYFRGEPKSSIQSSIQRVGQCTWLKKQIRWRLCLSASSLKKALEHLFWAYCSLKPLLRLWAMSCKIPPFFGRTNRMPTGDVLRPGEPVSCSQSNTPKSSTSSAESGSATDYKNSPKL